ncbi:MAG: hypothetical protein AVDCRST_MAG16-1854, partial [uncultured Frankineae bacterium]
ADQHHSARRAEPRQPLGRDDDGLRPRLRAGRCHHGARPGVARRTPALAAGTAARRDRMRPRGGGRPPARPAAGRAAPGGRALARPLPRLGLRRGLRLPARSRGRHHRHERCDVRSPRARPADAVPVGGPARGSGLRRRPGAALAAPAPGGHLGPAASARGPARGSGAGRLTRHRRRARDRRRRPAHRRSPV